MNRILKKYGKQIMAVLGALLMIVLAIPTTCTSSNYRRGDTDEGIDEAGDDQVAAHVAEVIETLA